MDDSKKSPVSNTSSFRNRYSMRSSNERGASVSSRMKHQGGDARPTYVPFFIARRVSTKKHQQFQLFARNLKVDKTKNLFTLYIYVA